MTNTKPVAVRDTEVAQGLTPQSLLERAVEGKADVAVIEKLMGLRDRCEANQARKAYNEAIAKARSDIPIILKTNIKSGAGGQYVYEDLASIARIVDPILGKYGLNYRWKSESNSHVKVTCVITHVDGHSEENSLTSLPDTSGSKNAVQALGSAVTYLQRYTLKLALGLATAKDDDGSYSDAIASERATEAQIRRIEELMEVTDSDSARFCAHFEIEKLSDLTQTQVPDAIAKLEAKKARRGS